MLTLLVFIGFFVDFSEFVFPAISLKSLSLWNCATVGGKHYLVQDYSLQCTGAGYVATSVFNGMFVVGVVLGWPLWLIYYLRKIALAGKLNVARVDDRIGTSFVAHSLFVVTVCACVFFLDGRDCS
jgi:hypothetical protein